MINVINTPADQVSNDSVLRNLWELRFKIVIVGILLSLIPIFYANNSNHPQKIEAFGYITQKENVFFSSINKNSRSLTGLVWDVIGLPAPISGFIVNPQIQSDFQQTIDNEIQLAKARSVSDLIKKPDNPRLKNFLKYPKYGVNAPILYAGLGDLFQTDTSGNLLKDANGQYIPIIENVDANGPLSVPIQRLLVDGIVHIGFTPKPGEIGNSYIVGHSSNFASVRSDYNTIFKPFERQSQVGEEFFVYDADGRELRFRVFEVLAVLEADTETAFKSFGEKRVVTLQSSILEFVPGRGLQPTKRWLTRGELVI
jgi:hypothetical protein